MSTTTRPMRQEGRTMPRRAEPEARRADAEAPTDGEAADALAELAQAAETHLDSFTEAIAGPLRVLQEDTEEWDVRRRTLEVLGDLRELLAVAKDHAADRLAHAQDAGERSF